VATTTAAATVPSTNSNSNNNNDNAISIDGILLDLGVSLHQIHEPGRGFSFMRDGPLDMQMTGSSGGLTTAAIVCNEFDKAELQRILSIYGDESRMTKTNAGAIAHHRPLLTTSGELVESTEGLYLVIF